MVPARRREPFGSWMSRVSGGLVAARRGPASADPGDDGGRPAGFASLVRQPHVRRAPHRLTHQGHSSGQTVLPTSLRSISGQS